LFSVRQIGVAKLESFAQHANPISDDRAARAVCSAAAIPVGG